MYISKLKQKDTRQALCVRPNGTDNNVPKMPLIKVYYIFLALSILKSMNTNFETLGMICGNCWLNIALKKMSLQSMAQCMSTDNNLQ